jgi:response regulator RpfG family c-di-GMP phosphodiesterase
VTPDHLRYFWSADLIADRRENARVPGMESDSAQSTILIVDDDLAILEYAGGVLEEYGYAVLTASNAASALVMLRSNDRIDLLFTDLVMPGSMASNWRAGPVKKFAA